MSHALDQTITTDNLLQLVTAAGPGGATVGDLLCALRIQQLYDAQELSRHQFTQLREKVRYTLRKLRDDRYVAQRKAGKCYLYTAAGFIPEPTPASPPAAVPAGHPAATGRPPAAPFTLGPKVLAIYVPTKTAELAQTTLYQLMQILADDIGQHLLALHNAIGAALELEAKS